MTASSSTSWDDAVEMDHPEFLASLSSPTTGSPAASAVVVQAEPHATTEGSTDPSVVAGGLTVRSSGTYVLRARLSPANP